MKKCWESFFTIERIKELEIIFNKIGDNYFPLKEDVLRFLNLDLDNIKYVILGMDPYPSSYIKSGKSIPIATGRSFEVKNLKLWSSSFKQSSLKNIVKTVYFNETGKIENWNKIKMEIDDNNFLIKNPEEWFESLENQGVMFLNSSLTVKPGKPGSHIFIWNNFMNDLIKYINGYNNNIKWLVWGNNALKRIDGLIDNKKIIKSCHPRNSTFIKENCLKGIKDINFLG